MTRSLQSLRSSQPLRIVANHDDTIIGEDRLTESVGDSRSQIAIGAGGMSPQAKTDKKNFRKDPTGERGKNGC